MEFLAALHEFQRDVFKESTKGKRSCFEQKAQLAVSVSGGVSAKGVCEVSVTGVDRSNGFALPEESNHPSDFLHGLLKLPEGQGWVYMKELVFPVDGLRGAREHRGPARATAKLFTDRFGAVGSEGNEIIQRCTKCVLFTDFNSCVNRFAALMKYGSVADDVRAAVEASVHRTSVYECGFLLPPPGEGFESKLNAKQLEMQQDIRGPVDFVQGPPGTGKSTFIVELLRARIPTGSKVLVCTTTNKAIDSLAEKLHAGAPLDAPACRCSLFRKLQGVVACHAFGLSADVFACCASTKK